MADSSSSDVQELEKIDAVAKVLGEPVFLDFSDTTQKARRNLLAVGVTAAAFGYWGLGLAPAPTVFGVQVQNLSTDVLAWGLLWLLVYLLAHFIWLAWDSFLEWTIRQTGTRVAFTTTARAASEAGDYPGDPRQSTLYNWWLEQHHTFARLTELAQDTGRKATELVAMRWEGTDQNAATLLTIQRNTEALQKVVQGAIGVLESRRVPVSLQRFDATYARFLRSQNLRWIALEFGFPVAIGLAGVVGCISMLYRPAIVPQAPASSVGSKPALRESAPSQSVSKQLQPLSATSPQATPGLAASSLAQPAAQQQHSVPAPQPQLPANSAPMAAPRPK